MKISVCMIVKNEQEMLPRALNSVIKWADEIIVVDTGSTDRTIAIAKQYRAKVYSHPWQNDFSLHRNQSIGYATGDWICILDADEQFEPGMEIFKKRLPMIAPEVSGLVVTVREIRDGEPETTWLGIRFFRKSSGIHYKNAVHNKAVFDGGCAATDVVLNHYGYSLSPEKMAAKRDRTESLLKSRLESEPNNPIIYYYLTQLKVGEKKYDKAIGYGHGFFGNIKLDPKDFQYTSVMYFFMAWSYLHLRDGESAYAWTRKGLEFYPDDLDLNYMMARIGFESKKDDWLKEYGKRYLNILPAVKDRSSIGTGKFATAIKVDDWYNRTTYTANALAERDVRKFMEAL